MRGTRADVIAEAETFIGTPFHHQGRLKGVGVDCAYLLAEVYESVCGMPRMHFGYYPFDWFKHARDERYMEQVAKRCTRVETPLPGDIALFKCGHSFSHGAIVVAWPEVIHAHWSNGVQRDDASKKPLGGREVIFFSPWSGKQGV